MTARIHGAVAVARRRGAANASGIALPGAVSGWTLTMAEDFGTSFAAGGVSSAGVFPAPYASEFAAYADGTNDTSASNNGTNSHYKASTNLSCTGSKLITLCQDVAGVITSATYVATPGGNYGQLYGRFSVCFRVPTSVHGFKIAFLMWPNASGALWPRDGELDWPEGPLDSALGFPFGANFLHQGSTVGNHADFDGHRYNGVPAVDGGWHVATLEWASTHVRALWDGVTVGTTYDRPPNTQMYWAIQTESDVDVYPGAGYAAPGDSGTVEVDWIACWNANSPAVPGAGAAPASTNLLTEPFTGSNGAAISATNWTSTTTSSGSSALIQTNKALFTAGGVSAVGGYADKCIRASNTAQPAAHIIAVTLDLLSVTECYPWIFFNDTGSGTSGYQLYFYANTSQVILADPADANVATVNWGSTWTTSTSLQVEILTVGHLTDIRVWAAGGGRPTNPTMETNTSAYAGTVCGLALLGGSAAVSHTCDWDDFSIASVP